MTKLKTLTTKGFRKAIKKAGMLNETFGEEKTLKTMKDLKRYCSQNSARKVPPRRSKSWILVVEMKEIKKLVINWVKEDIEEQAFGIDTPSPFLKRWMNRLDITEEDLK